jgi:hypothetical protein
MELLKGLGSALSGVTNLVSGGGLIDAAGNALGLPPLVTNAIKTAVGAATGNVLLAVDGAMGVAQELNKNQAAFTEYAAPKDEKMACEGYARTREQEASPVETRGSQEAGRVSGGSSLDPKMLDYLDALRRLEQNFSMLDATDGKLDGAMTLADLKRISNDARVSPELRDAARFMVDNPGYFERLDTSHVADGNIAGMFAHGLNDDRLTLHNLKHEIQKVQADFAQYGRPERPGSSAPSTPTPSTPPSTGAKPPSGSAPSSGGSASSSVKGIINDPSLSLEEKIEAILMALTERMDGDILKTMDDLAAAQDRQSGIKNGKGDEKALADAQRDVDRIQMRLQKLIEKRKMMFEMMSTLSMKFNEMAKTALSNMRSA